MKLTNPLSTSTKSWTARSSGLLALAMVCFSSSAVARPIAHELPSMPVRIELANQDIVDQQNLRDSLVARRTLNLARLLDYANAGVFPQNTMSEGPLNVFVDGNGHICAAANLIDKDGYHKLVQDTARSDNYTVLANVHDGPLMDWMLTSGFTQEEIALIQEPYMPIGEFDEPGVLQAPEPVFVAAPVSPEQERERVQGVLLAVHKLLSVSGTKSLGIALARLEAQPRLANALVHQPRSTQPPSFAKAP